MAKFIVAAQLSPSEYWALTMLEREELIKVIEKSNKS